MHDIWIYINRKYPSNSMVITKKIIFFPSEKLLKLTYEVLELQRRYSMYFQNIKGTLTSPKFILFAAFLTSVRPSLSFCFLALWNKHSIHVILFLNILKWHFFKQNFGSPPIGDHSDQVSLKSDQWFQRSQIYKLFTHDGRHTMPDKSRSQ